MSETIKDYDKLYSLVGGFLKITPKRGENKKIWFAKLGEVDLDDEKGTKRLFLQALDTKLNLTLSKSTLTEEDLEMVEIISLTREEIEKLVTGK